MKPNSNPHKSTSSRLFCFLITIIDIVIISILIPQYGNILENSDPSLVFCFMLTYTVATIMLAFALSTLFSRLRSVVYRD